MNAGELAAMVNTWRLTAPVGTLFTDWRDYYWVDQGL